MVQPFNQYIRWLVDNSVDNPERESCEKRWSPKNFSVIQSLGIIYNIQCLELRSKVTFLDPLPQNLLRFWHTFQLLVPEVNPLLLRRLAAVEYQPTESTAGKLLRVKSRQSPTSTKSRTINLHEWRFTNTSRSIKQPFESQLFPNALNPLRDRHW